MLDWRQISAEPNAEEVRRHIRSRLFQIRQNRVENAEAFLIELVTGRTVLDIGVVGHVIERSNAPDWKHGIIKRHAKRLVGVDILKEAVDHLNDRGYDVRLIDATGETDLGERFDCVVIGDVIEHVDNAVKLLRFAARHLAPGGRIMCTTPNPFYIGFQGEILREGMVIANAEHVSWISPSNAMELAHRAGVELVAFHHFGGSGNTWLRRMLISLVKATRLIKFESFSLAYIYIFAKCEAAQQV